MMMRREAAGLRTQDPQVIFIAFDTRELDADHAVACVMWLSCSARRA